MKSRNFIFIFLLTIFLSGCATPISYMYESSELGDTAPAILYSADVKKSVVVIVSVDGVNIRSGRSSTIFNAKAGYIVYVKPGVREIKIHAYSNNAWYYVEEQVQLESGHYYRLMFDQPTRKFDIVDMGQSKPSDMRDKSIPIR